jgi:hypothetical protein
MLHQKGETNESVMRTTPTADWRRLAGRIACMVALGTLLAGCDKCGDWWWSSPTHPDPQTCHNPAPKPQ